MNINSSEYRPRAGRSLQLLVVGSILVSGASLFTAMPARGQVFDLTVTGEVYHAQVTDHYCASATIQMMLDCTAVRSTNAYINTFLTAPDPLNIPQSANGQHTDDIPPQPIYNAGQVTFAPQVAIYNLIHGQATYTPVAGPNTGVPLTYSNPFWPWPSTGSGTNAVQWALNVLDNPTVGGNGNHSYTGFNVASVPSRAAPSPMRSKPTTCRRR